MQDRKWCGSCARGIAASALALSLAGCAGYPAYPPSTAVGPPIYPYELFPPPQSLIVVPEREHELVVPEQGPQLGAERREEGQELEGLREERHETPRAERREEYAEHEAWGR